MAEFLFLTPLLLCTFFSMSGAVPHRSSKLKREPVDDYPFFNCTGKPDGKYIHPMDCTRFIKCSNERTTDMPCAECDQHNEKCNGSLWLIFDKPSLTCEYPINTCCECPTPTPPPTTPTTLPPGPCNGRQEGDSCDKEDCSHCGYCRNISSFYFRCERTIPDDPKLNITGEWKLEECDSDLWWNPDLKPDGVIEGGSCDRWENLSNSTKQIYLNDPECVIPPELCEYGQDEGDECTGKYYYKENQTADRQDLECPQGLIFDKETETCRNCPNVPACRDTCRN